MTSEQPPVIIVGAGLAGLACALTLQAHAIPCQLLEASEAPGGRVRTDQVEGFALDRGFQVLLDSYPEARAFWDYPALNLGAFLSGAGCYTGETSRKRFVTVADPLRHPLLALTRSLPDALSHPMVSPADLWRLFQLWRTAVAPDLPDHLHEWVPDEPSAAYLTQCGFSKHLRRLFLDPFYKGVFLDPDLATSARKLVWTMRYFATGRAMLPTSGMGRLSLQLANRLQPDTLRLNSPVAAITSQGVTLTSGEALPARQVVIATDWTAAARLLDVPSPPSTAGTTCVYFAINGKPPEPLSHALQLNGSGKGLINNWCFPSQVAQGYAPPGESLACVTLVGIFDETDDTLFATVLAELGEIYGEPLAHWRPLAIYRIADSLPAVSARFSQTAMVERLQQAAQARGVLLAGNYQATGSIDGALASGRCVAESLSQASGSVTLFP